jgi:hypothetical protein
MQIILDMNKLKVLAKSVGISMKELCAEARVDPSTPSRIRAKGNGHVKTLVELNLALLRIEAKRREELNAREKKRETE